MDDQVERAEELVAAGQVPELTSTWTDSARWVGRGPAGVVAPTAEVASEAGAVEDAASGTPTLRTARGRRRARGRGGRFGRGAALLRLPAPAGEPCRVCGSKVRTQVVAGRNLFWCGRGQRRR